jgi:hypothetical protein
MDNGVIVLALGLLSVAFLAVTSFLRSDTSLSSVPGPFLNRYSRLPLKFAVCTGERANYIDRLHQNYGHFVRIAPNEVAVSELQAFKTIHRSGTGYQKADWYAETNPTESTNLEKLGVFQIQDHAEASRRRKLYHRAARRQELQVWVPAIAQGAEAAATKIRREVWCLVLEGSC